MNVDEFLDTIANKQPPAPEANIQAFERTIGQKLPEDYRDFLARSNGGHVGGRLWFTGPTPNGGSADAGVHHIGGFRTEGHFSLERNRYIYQEMELWIPRDLIWIMDDPFGNAICLGVADRFRGNVFFWDHENIPAKSKWNGEVDSAGNLTLLSNTFSDFVAGLHERAKKKTTNAGPSGRVK